MESKEKSIEEIKKLSETINRMPVRNKQEIHLLKALCFVLLGNIEHLLSFLEEENKWN